MVQLIKIKMEDKEKIKLLEKALNDILLSDDEEDAKEIANSVLEKIMFLEGF